MLELERSIVLVKICEKVVQHRGYSGAMPPDHLSALPDSLNQVPLHHAWRRIAVLLYKGKIIARFERVDVGRPMVRDLKLRVRSWVLCGLRLHRHVANPLNFNQA